MQRGGNERLAREEKQRKITCTSLEDAICSDSMRRCYVLRIVPLRCALPHLLQLLRIKSWFGCLVLLHRATRDRIQA